MKKYVVALILLGLIFGCISIIIAQPPAGHHGEGPYPPLDEEKMDKKMEEFHTKRIEKLTKSLNLTKEQADKISAITKDGWEKIKLEHKSMKERVQQIRQDVDKQIESLLTPEQLEKFKQLKQKAEKKKEMGFRRKDRPRKK